MLRRAGAAAPLCGSAFKVTFFVSWTAAIGLPSAAWANLTVLMLACIASMRREV
jgi:hypothetical protein